MGCVAFGFANRGDLRLGAALIGGFMFYDEYTGEGLRNDLFDPAPFVQLRFDLTQIFW